MTKRLEVKEIKGKKAVFFEGEYVSEGLVEDIYLDANGSWKYNIRFIGKKGFDHLRVIQYQDLLGIGMISFEYPYCFSDGFEEFKISEIVFSEKMPGEIYIGIWYSFDYSRWEHSWNIRHQIERMYEKFTINSKCSWEMVGPDEFFRRISESSLLLERKESIKEDFHEELFQVIKKLYNIQDEILQEEGFFDKGSSIQREFDFPDEIRTYCEQYLIYFAQFLKDVGVEATTSISGDDGKSIFKIKPKNKDEALEKIQKALAIYLNLPTVITLDQFSNLDSSMEIKILYSQIHDFQNKLSLAVEKIRQQNISLAMQNSVIGEKNRIIEQQNSLIQSMQSGRVLIESIQGEDQDCEEIISGVASIKKYELGPLEIDLPKVFRKVKELFKKQEEDED